MFQMEDLIMGEAAYNCIDGYSQNKLRLQK